MTYSKELTALLVVDPYNDFISEGGKIWPRIKARQHAELRKRDRQHGGDRYRGYRDVSSEGEWSVLALATDAKAMQSRPLSRHRGSNHSEGRHRGGIRVSERKAASCSEVLRTGGGTGTEN